MKLIKVLGIGFLLTMMMVSCKSDRPVTSNEGVLSEEQMVNLLTDIHLTEAALIELQHQGKNSTSLSSDFYKAVWEKHQTSSEIFELSLKYYSADVEKIDQIYDDVLELLSKLESTGFDSTFVIE